MNSDSKNRPLVELSVTLDDDTQLRVLDSHGLSVNEQTGTFHNALPAGRYVIEVERHGLVRRRPIWLTPKRKTHEMSQSDFDLTYQSAAPLEGVSRGSKESEAPNDIAAALSTSGPLETIGHGAEIFLFVRAADVLGRKNPARGIHLFDVSGNQLADLDQLEKITEIAPDHSWAAIRLAVAPGNYLLRFYSGARHYDRIVSTSEGFQTRVFLSYRRTDRDHWGVDPGVASVLAGPLGQQFDARNEHSQMADIMLRALDSGEFDVEGRVVSAAMREKIGDPMLGVYLGIYLASCLQRAAGRRHQGRGAENSQAPNDRAIAQIELILMNVRSRFPDVPDLDILAAWLDVFNGGDASNVASLTVPPMLAASWPLIRQVETRRHAYIAPDSLAYQSALAPLNAGPWFAWRPFDPHQRMVQSTTQTIPNEAVDQFVNAVKEVERQKAELAERISRSEHVEVSADDSLADVFKRIRAEPVEVKQEQTLRTFSPSEISAISRYALLAPEQQSAESGEIQDKVTGAIITPAQGLTNLKLQLGLSLENIVNKLSKIEE